MVYDILFEDKAAFLSTGFGIIKLNLERAEFEFTTFTGTPVFDLTLFENHFYAATDEGIYRAENNPSLNLADFNNWKLLDIGEGFPPVYASKAVAAHHGKLYLDINETLFKYEAGALTELYAAEDFAIAYLSEGKQHLIAGMRCKGNCRGKVLFFKADDSFTNSGGRCIDRPQYAIEEENGRIWYADQYRGVRYVDQAGGNCQILDFNSPGSHNSSEIALANDKVYVAAGGIASNQTALNRVDGIFIREDNEWSVQNRGNVPVFLEEDIDRDFYRLAVHPVDGRLFVGTYWGGLVEYDGNEFKVYTEKNSSLQGAVGDEARERVAGLAFDEDNNLWMSNHTAPKPISVLKADGEWRSFNAPVKSLLQVAVDLNGYKWFVAGNEGVLVFDDNGTIDNTNDDRVKLFTPANSALTSPRVNCLEVDLDGDVWVGTSEGPVIFDCGSGVFESNCQGFRKIVEQDGFGAHLLETENVQSIAVDGANQKWFGTNNGLFIQSPNGDEQVAFFNTLNSPLFDNTIIDIAINHQSGEAFIGTNKGIISYRGEAIAGGRVNQSSIIAFPNPVRPDYTGPIAIKGLARDANVKITDVSGQLIFETRALGGQAIWDGKDFSGRKASSGVYLVFSTSSRGLSSPNTAVAKILFIN
jgi:ligand-binding sensor domain-containing protein